MTITYQETDTGSSLNCDQTNFIISCVNVQPEIVDIVKKLVKAAQQTGKAVEQIAWYAIEQHPLASAMEDKK